MTNNIIMMIYKIVDIVIRSLYVFYNFREGGGGGEGLGCNVLYLVENQA